MAPQVLIISIVQRNVSFLLVLLTSTLLATSQANASEASGTSGSAIVREMNLARQNPAQYAAYLEELRGNFQGNLLARPGRIPLRTKEGVRAVDEAIRFLSSTSPRSALVFSPGMSRAAADHCAAQAGGGMSHKAGGNTAARISRYGTYSGTWGENISCGRSGARETVIALIVDDGLRSRKHRDNIFSSSFGYAGAAIGRHAQYRTICSIGFAGGYAERGTPTETLVASN